MKSVAISQFDRRYPIGKRTLRIRSEEPIEVGLDPGESIENQMITLYPGASGTSRFKIEQQVETSLTITDEDTHLDLVNWKHYFSPWREIKAMANNRFLTSRISEAEGKRFPTVTAKEIREAVAKAGGREWARLVRKINSPYQYPCAVGVSRVRFRILVLESDQWQPVSTLIFNVAMGC